MKLKFVASCCIIFIALSSSKAQYLDRLHELIDQYEFSEKNSIILDSLIEYYPDSLTQNELADSYHDLAFLWYYNKGWKAHKSTNGYNKAIYYFNQAIGTKKNLSQPNLNSLKRSLYNLGFMYTLREHYFEAIDQFRQIVEISNLTPLTASALRELGKSYFFVNDFHNAIDSFDRLISISQNSLPNLKELTEGHYRRAEIYAALDAKKYNNQIQSDLKKADSLVSKTSNLWPLILRNSILQLEGNRLLINKQYTEAIQSFEQVLKNISPIDSINHSIVYNSIGIAHLESSNYSKANTHLFNAISYDPTQSLAYENLGDLYLSQDSLALAISTYQSAINCTIGVKPDLFDYQTSAEDLQLSNTKYFLLGHLLAKANAQVTYYHANQDSDYLHHALETFYLADQLVDIIRFESSEYKSKLYWREQSASLYLKAVEVCFLLEKPDQAYYFMEKNKAILLLEDINHEQAKENSDIPIAVAAREYTLKQAINNYDNQLLLIKDQSEDSVQQIKNELYLQKQTYVQFIDSLEQVFPMYAKTKRKIDLVSYENFKQDYVSDQNTMLHYILSEDRGFGLLHTPTNSHLFEIDSVSKLHDQISILNQKLSQIITTQEELDIYHQLSNQVFQKLLPSKTLDGIKNKKLTIIPDHTLQRLSFETLNYSLDEPNAYLINILELKYAYSIAHLRTSTSLSRNATHNFVGFAPVDFDKLSLNRLEMSEKEVSFLQELCDGQSMLYEQANKQCFLDTLHHYKVIHLSTHADISNQNQEPWIAFHDQKISLTEIYNTKNQADMVVLSACNTSLGEIKKGEGVMSFARGFFYGGTKSVISSLWSTNDKSNQEILVDFYKGLKNGMQKSEALRDAKLNYIKTHSGVELSPFYWGSLILIGDNSNIELSADSLLKYYWIGGCLLTIILVVLIIIRYKT